jgi:phosphoglycerol transferase MdoB-like AlkP superfamily enzyme
LLAGYWLTEGKRKEFFMAILKFFAYSVLSVIAFFVALKLLAFVMGLLGLVLNLLWIAVILAFIIFVGWVIYKVVVPDKARQS